jgi:hypothetical protein
VSAAVARLPAEVASTAFEAAGGGFDWFRKKNGE